MSLERLVPTREMCGALAAAGMEQGGSEYVWWRFDWWQHVEVKGEEYCGEWEIGRRHTGDYHHLVAIFTEAVLWIAENRRERLRVGVSGVLQGKTELPR